MSFCTNFKFYCFIVRKLHCTKKIFVYQILQNLETSKEFINYRERMISLWILKEFTCFIFQNCINIIKYLNKIKLKKYNLTQIIGKLMIFSGAFKQMLPIIRHANRAKIMFKCFNRSYLWKELKKLELTINMRLQIDNKPESNRCKEFVDYLLVVAQNLL